MRRRNILIVDDELDLLTALELRFAMCGYETAVAADGAKAVALFCERKPDVVLMDVEMPELDGAAALRQMLEIDPSAVIIVVSGHVGEKQARMLAAEGARAFLPKPVDIEALERCVDAAFTVTTGRGI